MQAGKPLAMLVAAGMALAVAATPAGADPRKGETFELACDDGQTYTVATNGNGEFTPALDADSNTVFIPLSFGPFNFTITDAQGNVIDSGSEPGAAKGKSGKNATNTLTCTFSFSGTETVEGETLTFSGSGSVTGYATPRGGA
jgi:hypothetical protein